MENEDKEKKIDDIAKIIFKEFHSSSNYLLTLSLDSARKIAKMCMREMDIDV